MGLSNLVSLSSNDSPEAKITNVLSVLPSITISVVPSIVMYTVSLAPVVYTLEDWLVLALRASSSGVVTFSVTKYVVELGL